MASHAKKTKAIRGRKTKPNKANQKTDRKRIQQNSEILRKLSESDKG